MAPRSGSPTRAFEPTPALEHNQHSYSPFNRNSRMLSFDTYPSEIHKEVHFPEPPATNFQRAHSIATESVPLLPPIPSASTIPKTAFRITNPTPGIDITAYIENCRNLNEQLRQAHEAERRAWNIERSALKARIADLEFKVNKSNAGKRRSSIESQAPQSHFAARGDIRAMYQSSKINSHKPVTDSIVPTIAPVWKGPESTPPTTRVFQTEESNNNHLPRISEDEPLPSLSREISPTAVAEHGPVPIEQVDSTLDGITLKSAGLTSSFGAKITSPQFGSPAHSPSPKSSESKPIENIMHISASTLLSPLDEKLKRHAGHTPMAFDGDDVSVGTSEQPTEIATPVGEKPPAPAPTKRPPLRPLESSDSYFSNASDEDAQEAIAGRAEELSIPEDGSGDLEPQPQFEPEDDKPLTGPLMLDSSAKSKAASTFLQKLDAKLEAVKESSPEPSDSVSNIGENGDEKTTTKESQASIDSPNPEPDDDMPRLKLKKSTNFGSAYGFNMPGRM